MSQQVFNFDPQVLSLIRLTKNAFYPDKEIFLRELILNASDALDKIRFKSLMGQNIAKEPNLRIRVKPDKAHRTLSIIDNGIGMTKEDLINKLVTIEKPGTKVFIDLLQAAVNIETLGPFNVGFYSAFLVAKRVSVISKSDDEDKEWKWESTGDGTFSVSDDSWNPEQIVRGTRIILHFQEDELEFLEEERLRDVIQRRCDFIDFPIELQMTKTAEEEAAADEPSRKKVRIEEESRRNIEEEKASEKKETQTITYEWEKINKTKPIWLRKPEDVAKQEYVAFYKSLARDWEDPLAVKHFSAEGKIEFTAILFIPRKAPSDLYAPLKKKNNIRLYVRRVFVTDDFEELLPEYLSFVKGVVDSEDLPLNVPQDMIHYSMIMKLISHSIIRKVFELIQEISHNKEAYNMFYEQFSRNIKLGICEDEANRAKLVEFLRFYTSKSGNEQVSLKEYVARMKEDQKEIYFIIEASTSIAAGSPVIEPILEKGYEVVYMVDPIDENLVQELKEYDGKKLKDCSREEMETEKREQRKMIKEQGEGLYKRDEVLRRQGETGAGFGSKMEEVQ